MCVKVIHEHISKERKSKLKKTEKLRMQNMNIRNIQYSLSKTVKAFSLGMLITNNGDHIRSERR